MWYSARILYESRVDDDEPVAPLCEESVIIIEASDLQSAEARALEHGREAELSYKNADQQAVVWRFIEVVEVQDLCEESLTSGVEVYSKMFRKEHGPP